MCVSQVLGSTACFFPLVGPCQASIPALSLLVEGEIKNLAVT